MFKNFPIIEVVLVLIAIGIIFLERYILVPFLVKTKIIRLPHELTKYREFTQKFERLSILFVMLTILFVILSRVISIILALPQNIIGFYQLTFLYVMGLLLTFFHSLGCVCPKCGKILIDSKFEFGVDLKILRKPCPKCKFMFEKPANLEKNIKSEKETEDFFEKISPYISLFLISMFLAILLYLAIFKFFLKKEIIFHPTNIIYLIVPTIFIFSILLLLTKLISKISKCSICNSSGLDYLEYDNGKVKRFCRVHLLEEFQKEYLKFKENMVVVYPDLEGRKKSYYTYRYYTIEEIRKYNLTNIEELTKESLGAISGNCSKCSKPAKVAFFGKGSFPWRDNFPILDEIDQKPEILCQKCCLDLIMPSLNNFQGHFSEPIILPHKDKGIFIPITM